MRAAHLAACNAASAEESRRRGRLPTYHDTHTDLRHGFRLCVEEGGIAVEEETRDLIADSQERPGDVTLHCHFSEYSVAVDVTVVHVLTATECARQARAPGKPVAAEEKHKRDNYDGRLVRDYRFMPFAVDDFGHIGDAGWAVLEQLAAHAAENLSHDYRRGYDTAARRTHWLALWQRRIAWAVHAGIDRSLQRRLALYRRYILLDERGSG